MFLLNNFGYHHFIDVFQIQLKNTIFRHHVCIRLLNDISISKMDMNRNITQEGNCRFSLNMTAVGCNEVKNSKIILNLPILVPHLQS